MITVRKAEERDNAELARIIRSAFEEHGAPHEGTVYTDPTTDDLYRLFCCERSFLLVAEDDGILEGCCGIYHTDGLKGNCAELVKFYLRKEARGKGIGRKLMEECLSMAMNEGYTEIYLESLPQFSRAVDMYKKTGFVTLDHPMGNSGHGTCHIWMLKRL